jgi:prepilin-type N-terminal cleavage/methylation domain-containing protein
LRIPEFHSERTSPGIGGHRRSGRSRRTRRDAGFTLLEVLVALTILGLAVVVLIELSSQSLRLVKTSGDYQAALVLADRIATETQPSEEAVESGEEGAFRWERRIALVSVPEELKPKETVPGRDEARLFSVIIDVRWGRDKVVELATLRTPISAETMTGSSPMISSPTQQAPGQPTGPTTGQPTVGRQPPATGLPGFGSR